MRINHTRYVARTLASRHHHTAYYFTGGIARNLMKINSTSTATITGHSQAAAPCHSLTITTALSSAAACARSSTRQRSVRQKRDATNPLLGDSENDPCSMFQFQCATTTVILLLSYYVVLLSVCCTRSTINVEDNAHASCQLLLSI